MCVHSFQAHSQVMTSDLLFYLVATELTAQSHKTCLFISCYVHSRSCLLCHTDRALSQFCVTHSAICTVVKNSQSSFIDYSYGEIIFITGTNKTKVNENQKEIVTTFTFSQRPIQNLIISNNPVMHGHGNTSKNLNMIPGLPLLKPEYLVM